MNWTEHTARCTQGCGRMFRIDADELKAFRENDEPENAADTDAQVANRFQVCAPCLTGNPARPGEYVLEGAGYTQTIKTTRIGFGFDEEKLNAIILDLVKQELEARGFDLVTKSYKIEVDWELGYMGRTACIARFVREERTDG